MVARAWRIWVRGAQRFHGGRDAVGAGVRLGLGVLGGEGDQVFAPVLQADVGFEGLLLLDVRFSCTARSASIWVSRIWRFLFSTAISVFNSFSLIARSCSTAELRPA